MLNKILAALYAIVIITIGGAILLAVPILVVIIIPTMVGVIAYMGFLEYLKNK